MQIEKHQTHTRMFEMSHHIHFPFKKIIFKKFIKLKKKQTLQRQDNFEMLEYREHLKKFLNKNLG